MTNYNALLKSIKKAAIDAVQNTKPVNMEYGTVIKLSPLTIKIDQKFTLKKEQLVIPKSLTDYDVQMTVGEITNTYTFKNALKVDDKVILIREQGGQKYLVLDRVGDL